MSAAMWLVEESSYLHSYANTNTNGNGCSDLAPSHLLAYLAESCLPHSTGYFKASCNTDETVSVSEYTSPLCPSSSHIRTTSRPTGCLSLSLSSNGTAKFKYSCVASWRDAFPRNKALVVHKMFSDNDCGRMVGLHAMSDGICVAHNESAAWHSEYPTLTQYRIDTNNNNNNSDICVQSGVERTFSLPTSCGPSSVYFPTINGSLFAMSPPASAFSVQYTLIQADNSDSAGFPMLAIYGIIAGAVGLFLLILSALLLRYGYCTLSQLRVFPQHTHSGTVHGNNSDGDGDGSVAVISLARVEPEPPAVVEAALVANPSPIKGRQFPSAYPVSPYSSSPVQMFAEIR